MEEKKKVNIATINRTKRSSNKPALEVRSEPRITLPVMLFLRRPSNSSWYRRQVETENVSRRGARIICDVPLELGALVEVYGFNDLFSALAIVRHIERQRDGRWTIGLKFVCKRGRWIVI
jgi:hypothetical protein